MVHPAIFAFGTGIGLFCDKYILEASNFADDLNDYDTDTWMVSLNKSAALWAAVLGMLVWGPLSDVFGRRNCMLATQAITMLGALGCVMAQSEVMLICFRLLTGFGMGGEYPLASTHASKNTKNKGEAARNVGLLYCCGNGVGTAFCSFTVWVILSACPESQRGPDGNPDQAYKNLTWRLMFAVAAVMACAGLVCRYFTTKSEVSSDDATTQTTERRQVSAADISPYMMPIMAAAGGWFLYDFVEYGLKSNDAELFTGDHVSAKGVLGVFFTRISAIPSLLLATFILTWITPKMSQSIGFVGCGLVCLLLAADYEGLSQNRPVFISLYMVQYSFQMFMGVTTMAISATIFPDHMAGTGAGIAAAVGKVGAAIGTTLFAAWDGAYQRIFFTSAVAALLGLVLTVLIVPAYTSEALDRMQKSAKEGDDVGAVRALYRRDKVVDQPLV